MPIVTLAFTNGEKVRCEVPRGQTILEAAQAAGIVLAKECENGACQTCRGTLRSGQVEELDVTELSDEDFDAGAVLVCSTGPLSDAEIEFPYAPEELITPAPHQMTVQDVTLLSPTTARLRGQLPRRNDFRFRPGQYVNISLPGLQAKRSYSMASPPSDPRNVEFHIRLLPGGLMSAYVTGEAAPGATLDIVGPYGAFYLREADGPAVMIAGGTGLAPMISMLRALAQRNATRRIALYYGVTRFEDLYGLDELEALKARLPGLSVHCAVAEADNRWTGRTGYVTDLLSGPDLPPTEQVYVCGPPAMMHAVRDLIAQRFAADVDVFYEEFAPVS